MKKRGFIMLLISIISIAALGIYVFKHFFTEDYFIFLHKTGYLTNYNKSGQLDGEIISFKEGQLVKKVHFINGLKDGWSTDYYPGGIIKYRIFFKSNNANGPEYQYYPNGALNYKAFTRQGKRYGAVFWYNNIGKLDSYATNNILGKSFNLYEYDSNGRILNIQGAVMSPDIYSIDQSNQSVILLKSDTTYKNIKDLYLTIATPPTLKVAITVKINGVMYKDPKIIDNTVQIKNIFIKKQKYDILILSCLSDGLGKPIDAITQRTTIYVK